MRVGAVRSSTVFRCGPPRPRSASKIMSMKSFLEVKPYTPPPWTSSLSLIPKERIILARLPTPIYKWTFSGIPDDMELWIKRDDMTGNSLSGNKARKLEFLICEALKQGCDSLITIGGIQSNHCRATAVAGRYVGLDSHLILSSNSHGVDSDPGLIGNLLLERLAGAHIYQVSNKEYQQFGQKELCARVQKELVDAGKKPYVIPLGGTNALGSWGYIDCFQEILDQSTDFTDIVITCGSGAIAVGLALGSHLSGHKTRIHAYIVRDDPESLYRTLDQIYEALGAHRVLNGLTAKDTLTVVQAKGDGYAISKPEELERIMKISVETGVILDPVYTGKAFHGFLKDVEKEPEKWKGKKVLFVHTGGLLGCYGKITELQPWVESLSRAHRLKL